MELLETNDGTPSVQDNNAIFTIVHFYETPPQSMVNLETLKQLAADRVKFLKMLEKYHNNSFDSALEKCKFIESHLQAQNLKLYSCLLKANEESDQKEIEQAVTNDNIAHYLISLALCQHVELRRWFVKYEWEWFALRYHKIKNIARLFDKFGFKMNRLNTDQKAEYYSKVMSCIASTENETMDKFEIYKVKFTEVPYLVKNRRCYLQNGYAYIPDADLIYYLRNKFFRRLNGHLVTMSQVIVEDERIIDLIRNLDLNVNRKKYTAHDSAADDELFDFDKRSKLNYPLCMRVIHELLKETHHLRYFARMQYGLFIKGMGVPYEDAMAFWETEFIKKFGEAHFIKEYKYLFKHQYGKVGSKIDYEPYDCETIITGNVGGLDQHGCPFVHWDKNNLTKKLASYDFHHKDVQIILELVAQKKYKEACAEYFRIMHDRREFASSQHPNSYFETSMQLHKEGLCGEPRELPDIEDIFMPDSSEMQCNN